MEGVKREGCADLHRGVCLLIVDLSCSKNQVGLCVCTCLCSVNRRLLNSFLHPQFGTQIVHLPVPKYIQGVHRELLYGAGCGSLCLPCRCAWRKVLEGGGSLLILSIHEQLLLHLLHLGSPRQVFSLWGFPAVSRSPCCEGVDGFESLLQSLVVSLPWLGCHGHCLSNE